MASAALADGSPSMRARVTPSPLSLGCDSIRRRSIITPGNGRRAGKATTGRHAVLTRGIRLGHEFTGGVLSAVRSGRRFAVLDAMR